MLQRRNKTGGKTAKTESVAWHPNFRDVSRLPDTKTVRTKFFVNLVAATVAIALLLITVHREVTLGEARSEVARLEARIAETTPASMKAVADFKFYQEEEKQITAATAAFRNSFSYPDFLVTLARLLPPSVKVSRADYRGVGQNITIAGSVRGFDTSASDKASTLVKSLQGDEYFKKTFVGISLTRIAREAAEGTMLYEIELSFPKPAAAPTSAVSGGAK